MTAVPSEGSVCHPLEHTHTIVNFSMLFDFRLCVTLVNFRPLYTACLQFLHKEAATDGEVVAQADLLEDFLEEVLEIDADTGM